MTAKKHDRRQYDLVQQYLPGPIRNTILGIIHEFGYPYVAKPGMVAYLPGAMWPPTGTRWVRRSSTPGRCLLP